MKYVLIIFALIFVLSCGNNDEVKDDNHVLVKINNESGDLICESTYLLDSNIKDGLTKSYEQNGDLRSIINYNHGKKYGKAYFYKNGIIERECFFDNDKEINYSIFYENKKLSQYAFIDKNGNVKYTIDYNNDGKILKKEGHFFYIIYDKKTKLNNGKYKMIVHTAKPPQSRIVFSVLFNNKLYANYEVKDKTEFVILRDSFDRSKPITITGLIKDSINNYKIDSFSIRF
jgi:hypothetical protein